MQNHGWTHGENGIDPIPNWPAAGGMPIFANCRAEGAATISTGTRTLISWNSFSYRFDSDGRQWFDLLDNPGSTPDEIQLVLPGDTTAFVDGLIVAHMRVKWDDQTDFDRYIELGFDDSSAAISNSPNDLAVLNGDTRVGGHDDIADQYMSATYMSFVSGLSNFPKTLETIAWQNSGIDRHLYAEVIAARLGGEL